MPSNPAEMNAAEVQAWFESGFDHTPAIDTRTPAMVRAQAERENWK